MIIYFCWVTALLPSYQDGIVAGLASKGYMVGPAAKDGKVTLGGNNCPAAIIALTVYCAEETTTLKIYDDMIDVLTKMGASIYSVVISESYKATWGGSNFSLPAKPKANPFRPSPDTKKNVN
jgi:hypothetical protein